MIERSLMSSKKVFSPYQPTTGEQVRRASHGVPIYVYSEIANLNPVFLPELLGGKYKKAMIVLVQDPRNPSVGHWTCVVYNPRNDEYYFFSSYGGRPDEEKNSYIKESDLLSSNQINNFISDGLRILFDQGKKIHYNEYEYQTIGDNTATCGIWCVAFILSGMNPTQFHNFVIKNKLTAKDFYYNFF